MLSSIQIQFGNKLKKMRKKANLTQAELAEKLGVKRGAIANYEIGKGNPSLIQLFSIAEILDCEILELLPSFSEIITNPFFIENKVKSQLGLNANSAIVMNVLKSL